MVLCACDSIFGLHSTGTIDARFIDARFYDADLATACPPIGTTPHYSPLLVQTIVQDCFSFTFSDPLQLAVAECDSGQGSAPISSGPLGGPLTPAVGIDGSPCPTPFLVEVAPDGTVYAVCYNGGAFEYPTFTRAGSSWMQGPDSLATSPTASYVFAPSGTAAPHHMLYFSGFDNLLHEVVGDLGAWTDTGNPMSPSQLGVIPPITSLRLSSDGLRMTLLADTPTSPKLEVPLYSDRATIGDTFRPVDVLPGIPDGVFPAMTDDCTRAYFTGLDSVFYVQQIVPP